MKVLDLSDDEHEWLFTYLKGRREVDGESMEAEDLQVLDEVVLKLGELFGAVD